MSIFAFQGGMIDVGSNTYKIAKFLGTFPMTRSILSLGDSCHKLPHSSWWDSLRKEHNKFNDYGFPNSFLLPELVNFLKTKRPNFCRNLGLNKKRPRQVRSLPNYSNSCVGGQEYKVRRQTKERSFMINFKTLLHKFFPSSWMGGGVYMTTLYCHENINRLILLNRMCWQILDGSNS